VVLSPHLYPRSITGAEADLEDEANEITWKWDLSWGWKSVGKDKTSSVSTGDACLVPTSWSRSGIGVGEVGGWTFKASFNHSNAKTHPLPSATHPPTHPPSKPNKPKPNQGEPLRDVALIVGEFGASDLGDNSVNNTDTTRLKRHDREWLKLLARYLNALSLQNGPASWMFWSWNVSGRCAAWGCA